MARGRRRGVSVAAAAARRERLAQVLHRDVALQQRAALVHARLPLARLVEVLEPDEEPDHDHVDDERVDARAVVLADLGPGWAVRQLGAGQRLVAPLDAVVPCSSGRGGGEEDAEPGVPHSFHPLTAHLRGTRSCSAGADSSSLHFESSRYRVVMPRQTEPGCQSLRRAHPRGRGRARRFPVHRRTGIPAFGQHSGGSPGTLRATFVRRRRFDWSSSTTLQSSCHSRSRGAGQGY